MSLLPSPRQSAGTVYLGDRAFAISGARFMHGAPFTKAQRRRNQQADRELIILAYYRKYRIARNLVKTKGHQYVARLSRHQSTRRMRSLNGPLMNK